MTDEAAPTRQPQFAVGEHVRIAFDYSHADGWRAVVREIAPHIGLRGEVLTYKYHIQSIDSGAGEQPDVHFYVTEDHLRHLPA